MSVNRVKLGSVRRGKSRLVSKRLTSNSNGSCSGEIAAYTNSYGRFNLPWATARMYTSFSTLPSDLVYSVHVNLENLILFLCVLCDCIAMHIL